jgi:hypothetical protein
VLRREHTIRIQSLHREAYQHHHPKLLRRLDLEEPLLGHQARLLSHLELLLHFLVVYLRLEVLCDHRHKPRTRRQKSPFLSLSLRLQLERSHQCLHQRQENPHPHLLALHHLRLHQHQTSVHRLQLQAHRLLRHRPDSLLDLLQRPEVLHLQSHKHRRHQALE